MGRKPDVPDSTRKTPTDVHIRVCCSRPGKLVSKVHPHVYLERSKLFESRDGYQRSRRRCYTAVCGVGSSGRSDTGCGDGSGWA